MPIRIQIVTEKLNPISAAIRFTTRGWASHAEFVDTDRGITLGARSKTFRYPGGVQIRACHYDHYTKVEHFVLNSLASEQLLLLAWTWLYKKIGTPYNYKGIVGIATDLSVEDPNAMDCSQSVHLACWKGANFPILSTRPSALPWRITPRDLLLSRSLVYIGGT
jgi:uncharacterized protein YycO